LLHAASQRPPLHTWPVAHLFPHAPQLFTSPDVSMQAPLHVICFAGHAQVPFVQLAPLPHLFPHVPQFALSERRSTHAPLHTVSGAVHVAAQAPLLQTGVMPEHTVPQAPQLFGSVVTSTQVSPHALVPAGHEHVFAAHSLPPVHFVPHPPQLAGSLVVSTHAPVQLVSAPQPVAVVTHWPELHTSPAPHAVPHAPQLLGSLRVSVHVAPHATC
jgi:hypothetical protein